MRSQGLRASEAAFDFDPVSLTCICDIECLIGSLTRPYRSNREEVIGLCSRINRGPGGRHRERKIARREADVAAALDTHVNGFDLLCNAH